MVDNAGNSISFSGRLKGDETRVLVFWSAFRKQLGYQQEWEYNEI